MTKKWALAAVFSGVLLTAAVAYAKLRPGPPIMVSNLNYMNNIMTGFALSDFSKVAEAAKGIEKNAAILKTVKVTDLKTDIPASKQAEFVKYATALETEAHALATAAEKGEPVKAVDAYKNMIAGACYSCHANVRDP